MTHRGSDKESRPMNTPKTNRATSLMRLALRALGMTFLLSAGLSCSLLVNTGLNQCDANNPCSGPFGGLVCQDSVCVDKAAGACMTNAECDAMGQYFICRKHEDPTKNTCVSLVNELCTTVAGTSDAAWKDDNALIFGSILPTVGPDAQIGILVENGIRLALDEFANTNGIPSATSGMNRPLVLVGCNDGPDEDRPIEAARHLVDDVGVPAIIGYAFSGSTIKIATDVTIPAGVLLFSPSATSPLITDLADNDLVWRTSPTDLFQAAAQAKLFPKIEAAARARYSIPAATPIKVAIIHANDPGAANLADALQAEIRFNGMSAAEQFGTNYMRVDYGEPGEPDLSQVNEAVAFGAHITFLFGHNEAVDPVLTTIEAQWKEPSHRSYFVLPDAGEVPDLWNKVITTEDLRTRIIGTVPGTNNSWAPYATFRVSWFASEYNVSGSPDNLGVAGAYDIMYMLAYSAVAVKSDPMTGANLVKYGLNSMAPIMGHSAPPEVIVGPTASTSTFTKMTARAQINFQGASGPLDFDIKTGEALSDIQLWCVPPNHAGGPFALPAINSGVYYDSTTGKINGSFVATCELPPFP
jgi:ABC-type branched-subunit amino acid transport system substrate-binding protein